MLRDLSLLSPRDLVWLRAASVAIGATTSSLLVPGGVFSARVERAGRGWAIVRDYPGFRLAARARADAWEVPFMIRTDLAGYYGSIPLGLLATTLLGWGCDAEATAFFVDRVERWQRRDSVQGLPIGPEACGIPGTAFLIPVDRQVAAVTDGSYRFTDDMVLFPAAGNDHAAVLRTLDDALEPLHLSRSKDKTFVYEDRLEAIEAVDRILLAYLGSALGLWGGRALGKVRAAYTEVIEGGRLDPTYHRWFVRTFTHYRDPYALDIVALDQEVFDLDPRVSADYVEECGLDRQYIVDTVMDRLRERDDMSAGARLHALRILGG